MEDTDAPHEAIRRDLAGQHPAEICRALGYSKPWLHKWLKRDDPTKASWAQNDSRAPQWVTTKTPAELERLVCEIRQQLGVHPLPENWTINRILKRYNIAGQRAYQPRGTPYPALAAQCPHHVP